jgi:hypothetical protein
MADEPYNPLDKRRLGESVATALLKRPVISLPTAPFTGAGIYALYYTGSFPAYKKIADKNKNGRWNAPIYVGKAVPPGARKGGYGLDEAPSEVLYRRLREHAETIQQAENLKLEDFKCRCLIVDDIWIPLGESLLISMFPRFGTECSTVLEIMIPAPDVITSNVLHGMSFTQAVHGQRD